MYTITCPIWVSTRLDICRLYVHKDELTEPSASVSFPSKGTGPGLPPEVTLATLSARHFPEVLIAEDDTSFYRLSPNVWAWIVHRMARLVGTDGQSSIQSGVQPGLSPADRVELVDKYRWLERWVSIHLDDAEVKAACSGSGSLPQPPPSDDAIAAIAERAYYDPPNFTPDVSIVMRESVILRMEGFPTVAVSPEYLRLVEEWNANAKLQAAIRDGTAAATEGDGKKLKRRAAQKLPPQGLSLKHHDTT